MSVTVDVWCNSDAMVAQTSALFVLPPELLCAVFSALHELHHAVAFAVTCRYLLSVGRHHILRAEREFYAPWAACRLICIGSKTDEDDLPESMLTSEERAEVAAWSARASEYADGSGSEDEESVEKGFLGYIYSHYRLALSRAWTMHRFEGAPLLMEAMKQDNARHDQPPYPHSTYVSDYDLFDTVFGLHSNPMHSGPHSLSLRPQYPRGTRVLCNLSKAEYIREDGMTLAWGPHRGVLWYHVLLSLICWSSDPENGMPVLGNRAKCAHRGRWAGDKICMAVLEQLPDLELDAAGGRDWTDVSRDTEELLRDIWDRIQPPLLADDSGQDVVQYMEWEIRGDRNHEYGQSSQGTTPHIAQINVVRLTVV
ncbi:hypothetical protein OH76DRAFT_1478015 [Lentinus brumalis]|uniref:F-box domain-containing protein n=1 Tax=Lentinus brumalis TaxID=2498619 RepID=A0A371DS42_9APHY|nr:hypothetical protein OH76DRAFT_1478015 [Polyporus brumalis]